MTVANAKTAKKRAKKEALKRAQMMTPGPFVRPTEVPEFKPLITDDLPPTGTDGNVEE